MECNLNLDTAKWNEIQKQITPVSEVFRDDVNCKLIVNPDWSEVHMEEALGRERVLYMEALEEWNERVREKRKSQVDVLLVDDAGNITVQVINTRVEHKPRDIANFSVSVLKIYINYEKSERAYMFELKVAGKTRRVWLAENDIGDAKKMLRKFNSIGAEFLTNSNAERKNFILQLLCTSLKNAKTILVANRPGWFIADEKVSFIDKEVLTWENILKKI